MVRGVKKNLRKRKVNTLKKSNISKNLIKICPNCANTDIVNRYLMGVNDETLFNSSYINSSNISLLSQDFYFCRNCMYAGPPLEIEEQKIDDYASKARLSFKTFGSNTSLLKTYIKIENLIAVSCLVLFFILFFLSDITKNFIFLVIGGIVFFLSILSIFVVHIFFISKKK